MGKDEVKIAPIFEKMHFGTESFRAEGTFSIPERQGIWLNHLFWLFIRIPILEEKEKFQLAIDGSTKEWKRKFGTRQFVTRTKQDGRGFKERHGIFEFEFVIRGV